MWFRLFCRWFWFGFYYSMLPPTPRLRINSEDITITSDDGPPFTTNPCLYPSNVVDPSNNNPIKIEQPTLEIPELNEDDDDSDDYRVPLSQINNKKDNNGILSDLVLTANPNDVTVL